jgi:hypothetical protein
MPDQGTALQEAVTKTLLGGAVYSALLSPPYVQPTGTVYVPQPSLDKKIEYARVVAAMDNLPFDQNGIISVYVKSPVAIARPKESVAERFYRLADEWSHEVGNSSSMLTTTQHRKYREIINLGMDVVPFMLLDLQTRKRFWFPALYEITRIRPFDDSDVGNSKRMIQSWIQWGKRKKLI